MKLAVIVVAVLSVIVCNATYVADTDVDTEKPRERPCNLAFKCSLQDEPVWTTDGKTCKVFRNACHLANENCQRQNRYEPVLEVIEKEKCQNLCQTLCPRFEKPVCGYYNEEKRQFSNRCLMDKHICSTGQTYMIYNEGRCEEPLSLSTV